MDNLIGSSVRSLLLSAVALASGAAIAEVSVAPCDADTLGFYPFNDHPVGTVFGGSGAAGTDDKNNRVNVNNAFSNVVTSVAGATPTRHFTATGASPTTGIFVTNDVPGKYIFPSKGAKAPIAAHPGAVYHAGSYSGLECPAFAAKFTGMPAHTIEFFVKQVRTGNCYWFYADYGNGDNVDRPYLRWTNGKTLTFATMGSADKEDSTELTTGLTTLADGRWHHVALVYSDDWCEEANYGGMRLYVDYEWASGIIRTKPAITSYNASCRLGSQGEAGFGGMTSAFRVTKRALTPDEFMRASDQETGVEETRDILVTFSERPVGTRWQGTWGGGTWDNNSGLYGRHYTNTFAVPVFTRNNAFAEVTNDVPGRYLYPSLTATTPIVTDLRSLHFSPVLSGGTTNRTQVAIKYVGNYLARQPQSTVEFFWKAQKVALPLDLAYWDIQAGDAKQRIALSYSAAETMNLHTLASGTWSAAAAVDYKGEVKNMLDGRWHHIAVVYDDDWGTNGGAKLYCDYGRVPDVVVPAVRDNVGADNLTIGSQSFDGCITALRVTPAALTPDRFLYASDVATGAVPPLPLVWRLDGVAESPVASVANVAPQGTWTNQYAYVSTNVAAGTGLGMNGAVYSGDRVPGTRLTGPCARSANLTSSAGAVRAAGYGPLTSYARVFTATALVKATAYPAAGAATLLGVADGTHDHAWCLTLSAAGKLVLKAKLARDDGTFADYTLETDTTLPLNAWTRLVVTCDGPSRVFKVYCGNACVATGSGWSAPLALGTGGLVAGTGCGQDTFTGLVDEVSLERQLVDPADFLTILQRGTVVILR